MQIDISKAMGFRRFGVLLAVLGYTNGEFCPRTGSENRTGPICWSVVVNGHRVAARFKHHRNLFDSLSPLGRLSRDSATKGAEQGSRASASLGDIL